MSDKKMSAPDNAKSDAHDGPICQCGTPGDPCIPALSREADVPDNATPAAPSFAADPVPIDVAALRALCNAATPGPWLSEGADGLRCPGVVLATRGETVAECYGAPGDEAFIATARTAVPAMLDEIERLRADNEVRREAETQATHAVLELRERLAAERRRVERVRALLFKVQFGDDAMALAVNLEAALADEETK